MTELDKLRDGHVAWMRYQPYPNGSTSVHVCDSDHPKAFRVWKDVPALLDRIEALEAELAGEREAHAKMKAGLRELVEESGGDNLPCVACGFGHSANCDKGYETELIERADRAEAIVRGLREWATDFSGYDLARRQILAKLDELEGQ